MGKRELFLVRVCKFNRVIKGYILKMYSGFL